MREVNSVKGKTIAIVLLLLIASGSLIATSASTAISINQPFSIFSILSTLGQTAVALADPVGGGPGGGGDH